MQQLCPSGEDGYWFCHSYQRTYSSEVKRREVTHRAQRKLPGRAFHQDTDLVQVTRQMYFEVHHPTFDQEGSHNLSSLFWEMITSADLLGVHRSMKSKRFGLDGKTSGMPICAMRSLPKGFQFFCLVSLLGVTKGYGTKRDSSSWCTLLPCRTIVLPMVWERKGRMKGLLLIICGQCTTNWDWSATGCLCFPTTTSRGHAASWPSLQVIWCWRGRWGAWQWWGIHVGLIAPQAIPYISSGILAPPYIHEFSAKPNIMSKI